PQFRFREPRVAVPNRKWLFAPWFSPTQPQLRGTERKKAKTSFDLDQGPTERKSERKHFSERRSSDSTQAAFERHCSARRCCSELLISSHSGRRTSAASIWSVFERSGYQFASQSSLRRLRRLICGRKRVKTRIWSFGSDSIRTDNALEVALYANLQQNCILILELVQRVRLRSG